jgi:hypothetical protein
MLQQQQHGALAFPTQFVGSQKSLESQNTNSVALDYPLTTSATEGYAIELQNWSNTIQSDGSDIDPGLGAVDEHEAPESNEVCLNLNVSDHGTESNEIAVENWETQSHGRNSASSSVGSQCVIAEPLQFSNVNLSETVDQAPRYDLEPLLSVDMEKHLYV